MKLYKSNGHNPNSESAKAREEHRKEMHVADISCCKCGETHTTLYKVNDVYICKKCKG